MSIQYTHPLEATATNATTLRAMAFDMRNLARSVLGFIPILGDTADLVEQAYNKLKGQPVDIFLATIATVGLALDTAGIVTAGTTGVAAVYFKYLKHIYKASKVKGVLGATATVLSKILDDLLLQKLRPSALFEKIKTQTSYLLTIWKKGGFALLQAVDKFVGRFAKCGASAAAFTAMALSICETVQQTLKDSAATIENLMKLKSLGQFLKTNAQELMEAAAVLCKDTPGFKKVWDRLVAGIGNTKDGGEFIGTVHEVVLAYRATKKFGAKIVAMSKEMPTDPKLIDSGVQEIDFIMELPNKKKTFLTESKAENKGFSEGQFERYAASAKLGGHNVAIITTKSGKSVCDTYKKVFKPILDNKKYEGVEVLLLSAQGHEIICR